MTPDDFLSRLSAGLDRDEQLARAATPGRRWVRHAGEVYAVEGDLDSPSRCDQHGPGVPNDCDDLSIGPDVDFDPGGHIAAHMVRQQPRRTLAQVEAIRKVISLHSEAEHDSALSDRDAGFEAGLYAALESLASIYADPAEERE